MIPLATLKMLSRGSSAFARAARDALVLRELMGETLLRVGYSRQVLKRNFELPVTGGANANCRRCAKPFDDPEVALRHCDEFLMLRENGNANKHNMKAANWRAAPAGTSMRPGLDAICR